MKWEKPGLNTFTSAAIAFGACGAGGSLVTGTCVPGSNASGTLCATGSIVDGNGSQCESGGTPISQCKAGAGK